MATTVVTSGGTISAQQFQSEKIAEEQRKVDPLVIKGMVGEGSDSVIQEVDDLEKGKGDSVVVYLRMKGTGAGQDGDNTLEGNEEAMVFYSQTIYIGQKRHAFRLDGLLTEQRTKIMLRKEARATLTVWFGEWLPELTIIMLSGSLGTNTNGVIRSGSSFLGNSLTTPDTDHLVYANAAGTKAGMAAADVLTLDWIDVLRTKAKTLAPKLRPVKIGGADHYLMLISPEQHRDLRQDPRWKEVQTARLSGGDIKDNAYFTGAAGVWNKTILHECDDIRTFTDYGGGSVRAQRALFLGAQAAFRVYGSGMSKKVKYVEKTFDYDNQTGFAGALLIGVQKARFNSKDFGVIVLDTAAAA